MLYYGLADSAIVQQAVIDTFHMEDKPQKLHNIINHINNHVNNHKHGALYSKSTCFKFIVVFNN